jgi:hypothetical protein
MSGLYPTKPARIHLVGARHPRYRSGSLTNAATGDGRAGPLFLTRRRAMSIVTILIIIILILLAIYLFRRVF